MMSMGEKRLIKLRFEKRLEQDFQKISINGRNFFLTQQGTVFSPFEFPGEDALAIEYAENIEEAKQFILEDGDRFYLDEYDTEEELFEAMIAETQDGK